jgi:hypothetical protein
MSFDNKLILYCLIISSITIGLPTFFFGCNNKVTYFCPYYNNYQGYVSNTKIFKNSCKTQQSDENSYWGVYVYASNTLQSNYSTDESYGCRYLIVENVNSNSEAFDSSKKYYIGEKVNWYKIKNTQLCFDEYWINFN